MMREDKTALSWWFPRIEAAGVPVPRTEIIAMPEPAQACIWKAFDGKEGTADERDAFEVFLGKMSDAAARVGFPCFLRTDHTSGKHEWKRTCFLAKADDIKQHVFNLAEHSELCSLVGLPWDTWVLREFLPTMPVGICPDYGDMPVCKEFRFFVADGEVQCFHPYWPRFALESGGLQLSDAKYESLCEMNTTGEVVLAAQSAGKACGGAWSIDVLQTKRGWFVTDMAEAHKSWHEWPECRMEYRA